MSRAKVAVSLQQTAFGWFDQLVRETFFPSRTWAIQIALEETHAWIQRSHLARECSKLDHGFEKAPAEEDRREPERSHRRLRKRGRA